MTKMMEDQNSCRTQRLAMHQEPLDWNSVVPLSQKTVRMLLRSLQWGVTVLPWELVLSSGGLDYWNDVTQKLSMVKLDNLDQQIKILGEELRGSTFMRDVVYFFTKVGNKYKVTEWWGPGRGHPGNKIPNSSMVSTVVLGVEIVFQGLLPVGVNMGDKGITKSTAEKTMGLFQLGAVEVARQWMQEKAESCYKEMYRVDYMKIKMNFFSPLPM